MKNDWVIWDSHGKFFGVDRSIMHDERITALDNISYNLRSSHRELGNLAKNISTGHIQEAMWDYRYLYKRLEKMKEEAEKVREYLIEADKSRSGVLEKED